ncbi:hypothetical protein ACETU7_27185 [Rhodococcus sp. 3Y1]
MGIGPVGYLTEWRLSVAADLLADPARTVSSIAREVGYRAPCPHNRVHPSSRNEPEDVPPDPLCAFINRPRLIKAHSKYLNEPKPPPTRGSNDALR